MKGSQPGKHEKREPWYKPYTGHAKAEALLVPLRARTRWLRQANMDKCSVRSSRDKGQITQGSESQGTIGGH